MNTMQLMTLERKTKEVVILLKRLGQKDKAKQIEQELTELVKELRETV